MTGRPGANSRIDIIAEYFLLYGETGMGKPLMLQEADDHRIEALRKRLGMRTKVAVVRTALRLLEQDADRSDRLKRWQRAVKVAAGESRRALRDFRPHSRLRRLSSTSI